MKPPIGSFPRPTSANDAATKNHGGNAEGIQTTGANVTVSGSAPPTAGQALVATSPTVAAWGDVAASSSLAAQGDYLVASLASTQVDIADDAAIAFDTEISLRGDLTLDTVTNIGRIGGLKAGRTYMVVATIKLEHSSTLYAAYRIWDVTAAAPLVQWEMRSPSLSDNNTNNSTGFHIFTPAVDTEVEIRNNAGDTANHDVSGFGQSRVSVIEIGAVQANVVGGLEFIDYVKVTGSAVQTVTFGAAGDGIFQRILDGDVDEEYVLVSKIIKDGTLRTYVLRPNGATTLVDSEMIQVSAGTVTGNTNADMRILNTSYDEAYIETKLLAKTGINRMMISEASINNPGGADGFKQSVAGVWAESVTNIDSLEVHCTSGAFINVDSEFTLYRRTRTNLRADSAAVYERMALETVDPGALATTERTVGHTIYGGSLIGISARVEDAVTAGDITINVKIDGVTALTAVLDTTNSTSRVVREVIGVHTFVANKNISVEFVPTGYANAGSIASAVTVQLHLTNDVLIALPSDTVAVLNETQEFTKNQRSHIVFLDDDDENVVYSAADSNIYSLLTEDTNGSTRQLDNPIDLVAGMTWQVWFIQDSVGGKNLTFDTFYDWGDEGAPDFSAQGANVENIITCVAFTTTKIRATVLKGA